MPLDATNAEELKPRSLNSMASKVRDESAENSPPSSGSVADPGKRKPELSDPPPEENSPFSEEKSPEQAIPTASATAPAAEQIEAASAPTPAGAALDPA